MSGLLALAVLLFVVWILALLVFKLAGAAIHLLLLVAVVMLILWVIRRARGA